MRKAISKKEALQLLADGKQHRLRMWKLGISDKAGRGEVLVYEDAIYVSRYVRGGTHTVRLAKSGAVRTFRDICMFEIDNMKIYL